VHPVLHTQHTLHSSRLTPFYGTPESGQTIALDHEEFLVDEILQQNQRHDSSSTMGILRLVSRFMGTMVKPKTCRQDAFLPASPWPSLQKPTLALQTEYPYPAHRIADTYAHHGIISIFVPNSYWIYTEVTAIEGGSTNEREFFRKLNLSLLYTSSSNKSTT
jgi:hypothetical protein